jgi:hypothetical protein
VSLPFSSSFLSLVEFQCATFLAATFAGSSGRLYTAKANHANFIRPETIHPRSANGRASVAACMPTSLVATGSSAHVADLPRKVRALPETRLGEVGPKAVASAASGMSGFTSNVRKDEGGEGRDAAKATAIKNAARAIKTHPERFRFENAGAVCALACFSRFMRVLASQQQRLR